MWVYVRVCNLWTYVKLQAIDCPVVLIWDRHRACLWPSHFSSISRLHMTRVLFRASCSWRADLQTINTRRNHCIQQIWWRHFDRFCAPFSTPSGTMQIVIVHIRTMAHRHPCYDALISFHFWRSSSRQHRFRIFQLYVLLCSQGIRSHVRLLHLTHVNTLKYLCTRCVRLEWIVSPTKNLVGLCPNNFLQIFVL